MGGSWVGIPADRVVAVAADLDGGRVQIGSGYLVTERLVLTARHCTVDERNGRSIRSLRVIRLSGAAATATPIAAAEDVAVLAVADTAWAVPAVLEPPRFGRVDRSHSGELRDCEAMGFPRWQLDPKDQQRGCAELHGTIRVTEDIESGLLVMRDPQLTDVVVPGTVAAGDLTDSSPWGGLSGALVFHQGVALGVVIKHHPRQGGSAITILPVERFAADPASGNPGSAAVAAALGLPPVDKLPLTGGLPLVELVEILIHSRLPRVAELDPYTLGATASWFGNADTYGQHDEYVPRTKDKSLAIALQCGGLVVLVGPSKVGKTRTAFEVLRGHDDWRGALLAVPARLSQHQIPSPTRHPLNELAGHPALGSSDPLVIWLDDLQDYLPPRGELSQATISRLLDRPGPTVLVATLRTEQRNLLRGPDGELTREVRMVLNNATWIELASTRQDPGEQARAAEVYPQVGSRPEGLAEILAGAPELLQWYHDSATADPPLLHTLVQTCVDWARCGLARPIPEPDLLALACHHLEENRPDLDVRDDEMTEALRQARSPTAAGVRVTLLRAQRLPDRSRGYWPFDYLVAADDGQGAERGRPVTENTWQSFLSHAADEDAFYIGVAAFLRGNIPVAVAATRRSAEAGRTDAQFNLGLLLATQLDPPELADARIWYTKAAEAGILPAQLNLGLLLANQLDPPELAEARIWWTRAAEAGNSDAQFGLGQLLANRLDPPELAEARTWYTRAAEAGNTDAQVSLGVLLATKLDPPELAEARTWWTKAAEAGNADTQHGIGLLLADLLDPPELAEARIWWTRAAEAGNSDAQFGLGQLLANRLDPPELAEARRWYTRAAEAGNLTAQFSLGQLLATKLDSPELAEARTWWTRAAEAGNTDAQFSLGALLADVLDSPELAEARTWYTRAAEAGNAGAQVKLGWLLATKLDLPELAEARTWWTRAAEAGNTDAQANLGWLLADVLDPPELAEARTWYTRAAEAGNTRAQYNLGVLLATKLDPPELAGARTWWTRAAEARDVDAQFMLGQLLAIQLDPPEPAEARTWWTRAAEAGNTNAQANLGWLLADVLDPPELAEARTWYTRAAEAGNTRAQYNLGWLLATKLDPPELAEARTWWTRAAEARDVDAQFMLGQLLAIQLDPPELAEARTWWTRAAEAGNTRAQYNLGWLLATQLDPPDLAEARTWWTRAAEAGFSHAQYNLGQLLATQLDPPELDEARTWYTRAAETGHAGARDAVEKLGDG